MARYFFHIHTDTVVEDAVGLECPDDCKALELALDTCRDLASLAVRQGRLDLGHYVLVCEGPREVGAVRFAEAVDIDPPA